jgi:hypothetical protein
VRDLRTGERERNRKIRRSEGWGVLARRESLTGLNRKIFLFDLLPTERRSSTPNLLIF